MSKSTIFNVRCTPEEKAVWEAAAKRVERTFSRWIRDVLTMAATGPHTTAPVEPPVGWAQTIAVAEELAKRATTKVIKKGECVKRLPKGTFCKTCGSIH